MKEALKRTCVINIICIRDLEHARVVHYILYDIQFFCVNFD